MTKIIPLTDLVEINGVCLLATVTNFDKHTLVIAQSEDGQTERWFIIESLVDQIPLRKNWLLFVLNEAPRPQTIKA